MSIQVLEQAKQHPARDASLFSIKCIHSKDRDGWLTMWHADVVIEDTVGK